MLPGASHKIDMPVDPDISYVYVHTFLQSSSNMKSSVYRMKMQN
jgi:hypothetical protein